MNKNSFECPKCHKQHFILGYCGKCGYTNAVDPFIMEKIQPIDQSIYAPPVSWPVRIGHAEFVPEDIFDSREFLKGETNKYLEQFEG